MTFKRGKHRNRPLQFIPLRYLRWSLNQPWLASGLETHIRREINRRDYGPKSPDLDSMLTDAILAASNQPIAKPHPVGAK